MATSATVDPSLGKGGSTDSTAGASAPAVELLGITKVFPGVIANKDIDLTLHKGEVHCLLGENGAGKSTLMNILSGMYQPDEGTIKVGGETVVIDTPKTAIDQGIGMVYQHSTMIPVFTVLENLMLGATEKVRLRSKGRRSCAQRPGRQVGRGNRAGRTHRQARPGPAAAGGDHQGPMVRFERAHPRRADVHADSSGHSRPGEGAHAAQAAWAGNSVHNPQAPRGDRDR